MAGTSESWRVPPPSAGRPSESIRRHRVRRRGSSGRPRQARGVGSPGWPARRAARRGPAGPWRGRSSPGARAGARRSRPGGAVRRAFWWAAGGACPGEFAPGCLREGPSLDPRAVKDEGNLPVLEGESLGCLEEPGEFCRVGDRPHPRCGGRARGVPGDRGGTGWLPELGPRLGPSRTVGGVRPERRRAARPVRRGFGPPRRGQSRRPGGRPPLGRAWWRLRGALPRRRQAP
jgi:hypothetical protein